MDVHNLLNPLRETPSHVNQDWHKGPSTRLQHTGNLNGGGAISSVGPHPSAFATAGHCTTSLDSPGACKSINKRQDVPASPAQILLATARKCAELDTRRLGSKLAIMDIILEFHDLQNHEALMEKVERGRHFSQSNRRYGCVLKDEESQHAQWADQTPTAADWEHNDTFRRNTATAIHVSAERSTADWMAVLDNDSDVEA